MDPENRTYDCHGDDHWAGRDERLRLHLQSSHALEHNACTAEGLCPEENPSDVDEEKRQQGEAG